MRRLWLIFLPVGLAAQQPAVSPALPRLLSRVQDTTVSVWLFARPVTSLDDVAQRVTAAGGRVRVRSRWLHAVSADLPGIVDRIAFDSGRMVEAGEVLVQLDARQEQAQLTAAESQRELARLNLDRMSDLFQIGRASCRERV